MELARNPRVKQKLLHSLPVLGAQDKILDSKTVRNEKAYEYLEACIKENLRMHPIASEMGRRTIERPVVINGMEIPPYTVVSASYRRLHLDEHYWAEPNTFWPERWLQGDAAESAPKPQYVIEAVSTCWVSSTDLIQQSCRVLPVLQWKAFLHWSKVSPFPFWKVVFTTSVD